MSNIHTPTDNVLVKPSFNTAITAATNTGSAVDTLGYENALCIFYSAPSGSGTTSDCKLQDSTASGSGFADVSSATFTQVTTAGGAKVETMNVKLSKRNRYLKLVHTGAGGSAAGQAMGIIVLFNGRYRAPSQDVTPVSV